MRWALLTWLGVSACAPLSAPRATVVIHTMGGPPRNAVLAMPTECVSAEPSLCTPATYFQGSMPVTSMPFDEVIDPIVRLKLELAGYTLADARTLRLETVERTDVTNESEFASHPAPTIATTRVDDGPTVASLSPADRSVAATSLGLTGALSSTLRITRDGRGLGARIRFELVLELHTIPEGDPLWTAHCSELEEDPEGTARLVANCTGDGVLAWRAPAAVIGRAP
jgi:hypothetical protein